MYNDLRITLALVLSLGIAGCKPLIQGALVPNESFADTSTPPAPDYNDLSMWAALPDREDEADRTPSGEIDRQAEAQVDVFFLHPTTYYKDDFWNQPLDDEKTNDITDESVMRNQASAFNGVGRVYAPRYRQATLGGYLADDWTSMAAALNLAYEDINQAFRHYLSTWNDDRPIVLASHSQGSGHMVRLVHDFFSGEENADLRSRLVAVYAIGGEIPIDEIPRTFPEVVACTTPDQTGCIVVYNAVRDGTEPKKEFERRMWYPDTGWELVGDTARICVNPVTWIGGNERSEQSDHKGAVRFGDRDLSPTPDRAWLTAACRDDGYLDVDLIESRNYGFGTSGPSLHLVDYSLFYMDIRANAAERVDAFLAAR